MRKSIIEFRVKENLRISDMYSVLKLTPDDGGRIPASIPGQFVQVAVSNSKSTFLRRPISINRVDRKENTLWLLIRNAGDGTRALIESPVGMTISVIYPLGNGFSIPNPESGTNRNLLLVGGGVGVAPLLELGIVLRESGFTPEFLLGARSKNDLLLIEEFEKVGNVHIATDDGSVGHQGVVTTHSVMSRYWDQIYCCGPAPMMKAVASMAKKTGSPCEVSLENMMACGLGACLCCVENTVKGNVCVCTEGPVFNINELTW